MNGIVYNNNVEKSICLSLGLLKKALLTAYFQSYGPSASDDNLLLNKKTEAPLHILNLIIFFEKVMSTNFNQQVKTRVILRAHSSINYLTILIIIIIQ